MFCLFYSGVGGRDIVEDVREKFIERPRGRRPRFYQFKVEYYDRVLPDSLGQKVGEGEVILLTRRHPTNGMCA